MSLPEAPRAWAVVPAAGAGQRMAAGRPKQYLTLAGRTVLEHSVGALLGTGLFDAVVVVVAPGDEAWAKLPLAADERVSSTPGAGERHASVLNGLLALAQAGAGDQDWVAVHDAARPCVRGEDVARLMQAVVADGAPGALLAAPVNDTLKRAGERGEAVETVPRAGLWRALTPQVFRLGALRRALERAGAQGHVPHDEAEAMERAGVHARLVAGHDDNLKITRPGDLEIAAALLAARAP